MITLDRKSWKVVTDCKTVGEFMTEAAALFGGHIDIIVDGCRYEFHDTPKVKVTDNTPIATVVWDFHGTGGIGTDRDQFTILTKPKPKTVTKSGWVNIYSGGGDRYCGYIWDDKDDAEFENNSKNAKNYIATAHIEWEEVRDE